MSGKNSDFLVMITSLLSCKIFILVIFNIILFFSTILRVVK